jgi:hypothetical protein
VNRLFPLASAALCLTAPASAEITTSQHAIVVQENRTPDRGAKGIAHHECFSACFCLNFV